MVKVSLSPSRKSARGPGFRGLCLELLGSLFLRILAVLLLFSMFTKAQAQSSTLNFMEKLNLLNGKRTQVQIDGDVNVRVAPMSLDQTRERHLQEELRQGKELPVEHPSAISIDVLHSISGTQSADGGVVSGGGSIIQLEKRSPFLLDFIIFPDGFYNESAAPKQDLIFQTPITEENAIRGVPLDLEKDLPQTMAQVRRSLDGWRKNSPLTVTLVEQALKSAKWHASMLKLSNPNTVHIPQPEKLGKHFVFPVSTVVKGHGIWILAPFWNKHLGLGSRAGLLIHEALRYFRIETGATLSDEKLQMLTAYLTLLNPDGGTTAGALDFVLHESLWRTGAPEALSEERWIKSYLGTICANADSIVQDTLSTLRSAAPGESITGKWRDNICLSEYVARKEMPEGMRPMPEACRAKTWEQMSVISLIFWSHAAMVADQTRRAGIDLSVLRKAPPMYTAPSRWLTGEAARASLLKRFQSLRAKGCSKETDTLDQDKFNFMSLGYLLLKHSAFRQKKLPDQDFLYQFRIPRKQLTPEEVAIVERAYDKAAKVVQCTKENSNVMNCTR